MYAGQVIEKGSVEHILHSSKHPYTLALLEATSDPDAKAHTQKKFQPVSRPAWSTHQLDAASTRAARISSKGCAMSKNHPSLNPNRVTRYPAGCLNELDYS